MRATRAAPSNTVGAPFPPFCCHMTIPKSQGVQELIFPGVKSWCDWLLCMLSDWPASAGRKIKTAVLGGNGLLPFVYCLHQEPKCWLLESVFSDWVSHKGSSTERRDTFCFKSTRATLRENSDSKSRKAKELLNIYNWYWKRSLTRSVWVAKENSHSSQIRKGVIAS